MSTNKQPFFHRCDGLLFTATKPVSEAEFLAAVSKALKPFGLVLGTLEVEPDGWAEPDPGDPADLM